MVDPLRDGEDRRAALGRGLRPAAALAGRVLGLCRCERGAVAVEFALIALPLLAGSIGLIEFGRALWVRSAMERQIDIVERSILILEQPSKAAKAYIATPEGRDILTERLKGSFTAASVSEKQQVKRSGVTYEFYTIAITHTIDLLIPFFDQAKITMRVQRNVPAMPE